MQAGQKKRRSLPLFSLSFERFDGALQRDVELVDHFLGALAAELTRIEPSMACGGACMACSTWLRWPRAQAEPAET